MGDQLKNLFWQILLNSFPCDTDRTIVQSSIARSGSTWLSELLSNLPGYKTLGEPLKPHKYEQALKYGFSPKNYSPPYLSPSQQAPEKEKYLERVLTGRIRGGYRFETVPYLGEVLGHLSHRRLIVKLINGNRILHWINEHFSSRVIILLIRHPCAVVASMTEFSKWSHATPHPESPSLKHAVEGLPEDIEEEVRNRVERSPESKEEALALRWAIDYFIPLHYHSDAGHPWILVPYEKLVVSGLQELNRLCQFLGTSVPFHTQDRLRQPSNSTTSSSHPADIRSQLSKWEERLNSHQVASVLRIAAAFDLDFYTRDLEPDYGRLSKLQSSDAPAIN